MVRCFVRDRWRMVPVDDSIPVDSLGQPLLVSAQPMQLWPVLLSMAVFRVMAAYEVCTNNDTVPYVGPSLVLYNCLSCTTLSPCCRCWR